MAKSRWTWSSSPSLDGREVVDAGVVHGHVNPAEAFSGGFDRRVHLRFVRDVQGQGQNIPTGLVREVAQLPGLAGRSDQRDA